MKDEENSNCLIFLALLVIGFGVLEISFPHAMDGFHGSYSAKGASGLVALFFEFFLLLTWGKIGGFIAILLGILVITLCTFSKSELDKEIPTESLSPENGKNFTKNALIMLAFRAGKTYIQRKSQNQ